LFFDVSVVLVRGVIRANRSGECVHTLKSQGDMKQGSNNRRSRFRGGGGKRQSGGGGRNSFESNGPDVKIRGTAQQVQEKYLSLARDATSSGDWVSAEAYFQFAEHYHRIISANASTAAAKNQDQNPNKGQGDRNTRNQPTQNTVVSDIPAPKIDTKADTKAEPKPSPEVAAEGEAEVVDTSPAALAAAVAEREEAGDK
jgi:hypothetical protein